MLWLQRPLSTALMAMAHERDWEWTGDTLKGASHPSFAISNSDVAGGQDAIVARLLGHLSFGPP